MDLNQFRDLNAGKLKTASSSTYVTETDVDWSLRHFFVLLFVGTGCGVLSSYLIAHFNTSPSFGTLLVAAFGLCMLMTVTVFQSLLLKSFQLFFWVTLAEAAGLLTFFYANLTPWLVFGALVFIGYAISGFLRGRLDLTDHLTVHFGRFSKIIMGSVIGGLAIFLAFLYVGIYRSNGMSFEAFKFLSAGGAPVIQRFVPVYDSEITADAFFREFAREQLKSNPQFVLLLSSDQETVIEQTGYQIRSQLVQATQTSPRPEETFEHYLYRVAVHYLNIMNDQQLQLIPALFIILVIYGVIRGVMFIFKWPVILVSYLIYRILISVRLVYLTTEPRSKEIVMTR